MGEFISYFEIDANWGESVRKNFLVLGMQFKPFTHVVKLKKACRDDKPFVWILEDHELFKTFQSNSSFEYF